MWGGVGTDRIDTWQALGTYSWLFACMVLPASAASTIDVSAVGKGTAGVRLGVTGLTASHRLCCSKIAEAEAGVSVNEKKWLVMHVHVQMRPTGSVYIRVVVPGAVQHAGLHGPLILDVSVPFS